MAKQRGFNSIFRFKQFTLAQGDGVFRLGTDAVLLGCWPDLDSTGGPILDVGTGTGAIALMLAQRTQRDVWGIDTSLESKGLAQKNAQSSPWANRIQIFHTSVELFQPPCPPADIVFNPPFFFNHTPNTRPDLTQARHANPELPMQWFGSPAFVGMQQGGIHFIIPSSSFKVWERVWKSHNWFLVRHLRVQGRFAGPVIRSVLSLSRTELPLRVEDLHLYESNGQRSMPYQKLCSEFYLD